MSDSIHVTDKDTAEEFAQKQLYPDNGVFQFTRKSLDEYRNKVEQEYHQSKLQALREEVEELVSEEEYVVNHPKEYHVSDTKRALNIMRHNQEVLNLIDNIE